MEEGTQVPGLPAPCSHPSVPPVIPESPGVHVPPPCSRPPTPLAENLGSGPPQSSPLLPSQTLQVSGPPIWPPPPTWRTQASRCPGPPLANTQAGPWAGAWAPPPACIRVLAGAVPAPKSLGPRGWVEPGGRGGRGWTLDLLGTCPWASWRGVGTQASGFPAMPAPQGVCARVSRMPGSRVWLRVCIHPSPNT